LKAHHKLFRMTPRRLFRRFAFAEAVTWTLLIGGLTIKSIFGAPQLALTVVGAVHGAVFLTYAVIASVTGVNQRWGLLRTILAVSLALVPYATIPFEIYVERSGRLKGDWRREHSGDTRDDHWFDRLFRWFIIRPALLAGAMILVVAVIFASLLVIGPPGGWPKQ
jgi:integral membrane protein